MTSNTTDSIMVALIVSIPPTIAALAALRRSGKVHKEVSTSNGQTVGQIIEQTGGNVTQTAEDVTAIKEQLEETWVTMLHHLLDNDRHLERRDSDREESS
jgi:hypothetical protein